MTDSVQVFPPGFRVTDNATGAAVSGAVIRFYDAGTTTPKTVYSDSGLVTSLGTSVTCDSLGAPTSDGSTDTLIYTGSAAYKIRIETSSGVEIVTYDNVKGADAIFDPGTLSIVATTPVLIKSLDYTILDADQSSVFVGNCSSGDVTFTLPSAVTVGDGWYVDIQHAGSANQVLLATVSSQTISSGATSYSTVMVLSRSGESVRLTSDGANWRVTAHAPPHIKHAQGVILVTDRLTAPPGSEVNGSIYLISGTPSGDWSSFSAGDLVQYTSSAWVRFSPVEGWTVWVADEDAAYSYDGSSWVNATASTSVAGRIQLADQTAMEAETSGRGVTANVAKYHPGAVKAWVVYNTVTTTSITTDYGVSSLTDESNGQTLLTVDTAFSSGNFAATANAQRAGINDDFIAVVPKVSRTNTTTTCVVQTATASSPFGEDSPFVSVQITGYQ